MKEEDNENYELYCKEYYGEKSCIIKKLNDINYQIQRLDKSNKEIINSDVLYKVIPKLIEHKYIVIIVEKIISTNKDAITSVHFPEGNSRLISPVWPH